MNWLVNAIIKFAQRTPYLHLYHADRTPYMERWWVLESRWLMVKVHHICSPDYDRHMHDHPWWFCSMVLRGWYIEHLPMCEPAEFVGGRELSTVTKRKAGSVAFRRLGARHRITQVSPDGVWTLFINGPRAKRWGFHTESGWVFWKDYPSCHEAGQVTY